MGSATKKTAIQTILLAASDLLDSGKTVFTEWDLAVAAWKRDPQRFGLRGYEDQYPDHKRLSCEILGKRRSNPLCLGYLMKDRPNHYYMTNRGRVVVRSMSSSAMPPEGAAVRDCIRYLRELPQFIEWQIDPSNPKVWWREESPEMIINRMAKWVETAIAMWNRHKKLWGEAQSHLTKMSDLSDLHDFVQAMRYRFSSVEACHETP